ncbi:MAG: S-layer homology domain-containing protein [Oscillospiraceae bacterium]|nr:S-layer homology domain-containing protein [Oscillospiraceae bacterium]
MKKGQIRVPALLLAVMLVLGMSVPASAVTDETFDKALLDTAEYVYNIVHDPQVGSVGGEWAVMALARSGYAVPEEYYQKYYATLEAYVKACDGNLHDKKYTEYSRVILALTALGKDPTNVAGYNLLTPLGDYDKTIWQGLNGPIWALIALDTGNYPMPENEEAAVQATRDMYVDRILECQLDDGGFSLFGGTALASTGDSVSDPDITGMALQALAKYQDRDDVKQVTEAALSCMSQMQLADGGFASWGTKNSESVVQIIVALCELGLPVDDARFIKNGNTLLDNLMTYYQPGAGFLHTQDGSGSNQMATEQALYGLIAAQRLRDGKPSLYRMTDALTIGDADAAAVQSGAGLTGKNADVTAMPITQPGITFDDISGANYHVNAPAIEALAARGIINGKSASTFDPDGTVTRAEFAAIIVRGLGLTPQENAAFGDVSSGAWYAGYVGTANRYGIVSGVGDGLFHPDGTITREEAAVMVARAAKLCGMETQRESGAVRDVLAQFYDYVTVASWAQESMAFCYDSDILSQQEDAIRPQEAILRGEVAQMLLNMLGSANLL